MLDGVIYWIVVVPVRAPDPVAFIAAGVPVNDALLERLRELSLVTHSLALATPRPNGAWTVVAKTAGYTPARAASLARRRFRGRRPSCRPNNPAKASP